ncbi:MAG: SurA N-terminal domain-containing protein, partial [Dongiaceae bacterium]
MIKILFGFLILSFAAWGVPDLYQAIQPQAVAASVGGEDISADELRRRIDRNVQRLQSQLQGQPSPEILRQLRVAVTALEELIVIFLLSAFA